MSVGLSIRCQAEDFPATGVVRGRSVIGMVPVAGKLTSMEVSMSEKWILNRKELHLGYIKETFRAGAVIELDEAHHTLIVDGRKFPDTRDLDVLKRQATNNPDAPWILPYSKEGVVEVKEAFAPREAPKQKPKPGENMQVVKSDEDLMDTDIDIRDTQISKKTAAAKIAARQRVKTHGMEVIRGDESVEERIASLKGKNDISSVAERVRLKSTGSARMPVVKDDSLGSAGGSKAAAMNAGQVLPSRATVEAKTDDAKAKAAARKAEAEALRARMAKEAGEMESESPVAGEAAEEATEAPEAGSGADKDAQIAALQAQLAELKAGKIKRVPVRRIKQAKKVVGA